MIKRIFFESVIHKKEFSANVFISQIQNSIPHWHYDYEMILLLKGKIQVLYGEKPILMTDGDVLLINSKSVHSIWQSEPDNIVLIIQFSPFFFEKVLDEHQMLFFYLDSTADDFKPLKPFSYFAESLAKIGLASLNNSMAMTLRMQALIQTLIADLVDLVQYDFIRIAVRDENGEEKIVARIGEYVEHHYMDEMLTENLYTSLKMSEKTVYRYLRKHLGVSLKELVDITRTEKARDLLQKTDRTIASISSDCGFSTEVSFYRIFKKKTGITPKEYRKGFAARQEDRELRTYLNYNIMEAEKLLKNFVSSEWVARWETLKEDGE